MIEVLLRHLLLHDGALQVLISALLVLNLVFHKLLHGPNLYLAVLRLEFSLQRHLGHLVGLLHFVLILQFLRSLMLRFDLHGVVVQAPILVLDGVDAGATVPVHLLLEL